VRHLRVGVVVLVGIVLYITVTAVYFGTAYLAARAQAASVALGAPMPGPGLGDQTWGVRLGEPRASDLAIIGAGLPQPTSLTSVTFNFVLSNNTDSRVPPLAVFVGVRLTLRGWSVTGDGIAG
jgi:hypothetical protein